MTKELEDEKFKKMFGDHPSFDGYSKDTLDLLKFCSSPAVMNMARWNKWREDNPEIKVNLPNTNLHKAYLIDADLKGAHLEGADFKGAHLEGADFTGAWLNGAHFEGAIFSKKDKQTVFSEAKLKKTTWSDGVHLEGLKFNSAEFQGTNLHLSHFEGANLGGANFEEAILTCVHFESVPDKNLYSFLQGCRFNGAKLKSAIFDNNYLYKVHFEQTYGGKYADLASASFVKTIIDDTTFNNAYMGKADFTGATIISVNFRSADLRYTILESTSIYGNKIKTNLSGTKFTGASVNGKTIIKNCDIDEKTDFSAVNLDSARVEPKLLATLKTNIRRISWRDYYKEKGEIVTMPIRFFWWLSDYGSSSVRIGLSILIATLFFTDVYLVLAKVAPGAFTLPDKQMLLIGSPFHDYIRVLCFAISTMVTLGFGGINIKILSEHNWLSTSAFGFVTLNLVLGYLFLSVLVTRFGILFQSQAPEQKNKKTNNTLLYFIALILFASNSYMLFCWEDIIGFINYAGLITVLFGMEYLHFK